MAVGVALVELQVANDEPSEVCAEKVEAAGEERVLVGATVEAAEAGEAVKEVVRHCTICSDYQSDNGHPLRGRRFRRRHEKTRGRKLALESLWRP